MVEDWVSTRLEQRYNDSSSIPTTNGNRETNKVSKHRRSRDRDDKEERRRERGSRKSSRESERHHRRRRRSRSRSRDRESRHKSKHQEVELSPEDRDVRTVMVSNLSNKVVERDLKEVFRPCGKIKAAKIIRDTHTGRSKGIAYIEFAEVESVNKATDLTGRKMLGFSMIVETSQAEKNREYAARTSNIKKVSVAGGKQIKVDNVHREITTDMLKDIFSHFGTIVDCVLSRDDVSQQATNVAFITFTSPANAKATAQSMDGFELADQKLKITQMMESSSNNQRSILDSEIVDRGGVNLGKTGRFELMAKLAEGSGLVVPNLNKTKTMDEASAAIYNSAKASLKNVPTQCIVISNFFDSKNVPSESEILKIKDEVIEIVNKHGGCFHISVDKQSLDGNVFVKCQTVGTATAAFTTFNGKDYEGRKLTAVYLPISTYNTLFPEATHTFILLSSANMNKLNP